MTAFAQVLTGNPIVLIRCGPNATKYGDRFDYAVVLEVLGQTAMIRALVADGQFGMRYAGPILDVAKRYGKPDWERL